MEVGWPNSWFTPLALLFPDEPNFLVIQTRPYFICARAHRNMSGWRLFSVIGMYGWIWTDYM